MTKPTSNLQPPTKPIHPFTSSSFTSKSYLLGCFRIHFFMQFYIKDYCFVPELCECVNIHLYLHIFKRAFLFLFNNDDNFLLWCLLHHNGIILMGIMIFITKKQMGALRSRWRIFIFLLECFFSFASFHLWIGRYNCLKCLNRKFDFFAYL